MLGIGRRKGEEDGAALLETASRYFTDGRYREALEDYRSVARSVGRLDALTLAVDCLLHMGQKEDAIKEIGSFLERFHDRIADRDQASLLWEIVILYDELREYGFKLQYLDRIEGIERNARSIRERARTLLCLNDHQKAIECYSELIGMDPLDQQAWVGIARGYEGSGATERAEETYLYIMRMFADNAESRAYLARRRFVSGHYQEAVDLITEAAANEMKKDKAHRDGYTFYLAGKMQSLYDGNEETVKAIGFLTHALDMDNADIESHRLRSELLLKLLKRSGSLCDQWYEKLAYDLYCIATDAPSKERIDMALSFVSKLPKDAYWKQMREELKGLLDDYWEDEGPDEHGPLNSTDEVLLAGLSPHLANLSGPSLDHIRDLVHRRLFIDPKDVLALYIKQVLLLSEGDFHRAEKEVGDVLFLLGIRNRLTDDSAAFWVKVHEFVGSENSRLGANRRSTKDLEPFELDRGAAKRMLDFISGKVPSFLSTIEPCLGSERDGRT